MARFNADTIDRYGGQGGTGYFSLKNDKDVAAVRFLYNDANDIEGYAVHQVEVDGKKRYVNCIREYNEPVDKCPFCKARQFQMAKLFVPVYNIDEDKVQIWERGKKFFSKLSSLLSRYDRDPIVSQVFEIERNGRAGDTQTSYEIFRLDREYPTDDTKLEDFEKPNILGGVVLDKSAEDMEYYLANGTFPSDDTPRRRTITEDERPRRRTPASEDSF